jgi:hypothetical protein
MSLVQDPSTGTAAAVKAASTAAVAADPSLVVALSPNSTGQANISQIGGVAVPVNLGLVPVDLSQVETVFKHVVVSGRLPQIEISFNLVGPASLVTSTLNGTGTVSGPTTGSCTFGTGTGTTGRSLGVSFTSVVYSPHEEIYAAFTAAFTAGVAGTYQRIGLYNTTDGFSFGYNGTTFGLWLRFNSVDTFIAQSSWNVDTLSGGATSKFARADSPEALAPTDINLYRVRFGWLGIAPVVFEVLSADGNFVTVHIARFPNSQATVSVTTPYLPIMVDVNNNATGTTNLVLTTGCWVAGASTCPIIGGGFIGSIITANIAGNTGPATAGSSVTISTVGLGALGIGITGTWTGTLTFQYSMDGNNWFNDFMYNSSTGAFVTSITASGNFEVAIGAYRAYRIVSTAAMTGTAIITINGGLTPSIVNTLSAITDGANNGPVAVKPASTQSAVTDQALVVALSPASAQTRASTTTVAGVASSASSVTILAANAARLGAVIVNSSTAILFLRYSSTAASNASGGYTVSVAATGGVHTLPFGYTGQITGIWASANGFANVTELTV